MRHAPVCIVIGRNDDQSVVKTVQSLLVALPQPDIIYVRDRAEGPAPVFGSALVHTESPLYTGTERRTASNRNFGIAKAMQYDMSGGLLFIDSDRWVTSGSLDRLLETRYDTELLLLEDDKRWNISQEVYVNQVEGYFYNAFFSNGVWLSEKAFATLFSRLGTLHIWPEDMESEWGIEDTYFGDCVYAAGLTSHLYQSVALHGRFDRFKTSDKAARLRKERRAKLTTANGWARDIKW